MKINATSAVIIALGFLVSLPMMSFAKMEKPTLTAEDFYRFLRARHYEDAAELLTRADQANFKRMQAKMKKAGSSQNTQQYTLEKLLADKYFLMYSQENKKMFKKAGDGETIIPEKIGFFVPGQYYIIGNYALVFTRETYYLAHEKTGPVRDDPRKLWIDPTNDLSKVRDEAYFKRWWEWDEDMLTMPGIIWMVKERNEWKIDLLSGITPKTAFREILKWHFGRDVFEKPAKKSPVPKSGK